MLHYGFVKMIIISDITIGEDIPKITIVPLVVLIRWRSVSSVSGVEMRTGGSATA